MAKTRINKNEKRRIFEKEQFAQAARIRILVGMLPNQAAYDAFLLQESDAQRRKALFEFTKGYCKFSDPQFPSTIKVGGLVGPDGRPL